MNGAPVHALSGPMVAVVSAHDRRIPVDGEDGRSVPGYDGPGDHRLGVHGTARASLDGRGNPGRARRSLIPCWCGGQRLEWAHAARGSDHASSDRDAVAEANASSNGRNQVHQELLSVGVAEQMHARATARPHAVERRHTPRRPNPPRTPRVPR